MRRRTAVGAALVIACAAALLWLASRTPDAPSKPGPERSVATAEGEGAAQRPTSVLRRQAAATDASAAAETVVFEGHVLDVNDGSGIEGAELFLKVEGRVEQIRTDVEGHFALAPGDAESLLIAIHADGFEPFLAPPPGTPWSRSTFGPGARTLRFVLEPRFASVALVRAHNDRAAVAGARVTRAFNLLGLPHDEPERFSNEQGEFDWRPFPGDVLRIEHQGFAFSLVNTAIVSMEDFESNERKVVVDLRPSPLRRDFVIEGVVLDDADAGVAGARVEAMFLSRDAGDSLWPSATTDLDGRFQLIVEGAGRHLLTALGPSGDGPAAFGSVVTGSSAEVVLRLTQSDARLEGRVTDGEGAPLTSFTIGLVEATLIKGLDERYSPSPDRIERVLSPDGTYRIRVEPGHLQARVSAAGFAPSPLRKLEAKAGGVTRFDVVLTRGRSVSGRVIDRESRAPIAGGSVRADQDDDDRSNMYERQRTDDAGTFRLSHVQIGAREVSVRADGYVSRSVQITDDGILEIDLARVNRDRWASEFEGLGIVLGECDGGIEIASLYPGGGALSAGLQEHDCMLAIDGEPTAGMTGEEFGRRGRGSAGTMTRLRIGRGDAAFEVNVVRRRIRQGE